MEYSKLRQDELREALVAMVYVYLRDCPIASTVVERTVGHLTALRGVRVVYDDDGSELEATARRLVAEEMAAER